MGLPGKAASLLADGLARLDDTDQRAMAYAEMARCSRDRGDLKDAKRLLTDAVRTMSPGRECYLVACELADVCLKLGEDAQAIAVVDSVLATSRDRQVRGRASTILGQAYMRQGKYDRAALAFSSLLHPPPGEKKP
jgi:tetratricopeptide (TPR) repeat protein